MRSRSLLALCSIHFISVSGLKLPRRAVLTGTAATATAACTATAGAYDDSTFKSVSTQVGGNDFLTTERGVKYKDLTNGSGVPAHKGDTVAVQLSGRCLNLNGKKFISTQDAAALVTGLAVSEPYTFTIGAGQVIPGLEDAVLGMSKGSLRRAVIPQNLGYDTAMTLGPTPQSFQDLRSLESIVKNPNRDASLLIDVKVERIKAGS